MRAMAASVTYMGLLVLLTSGASGNMNRKQCDLDPCQAECEHQNFGSMFGGYASCEDRCGSHAVHPAIHTLQCYCDSLCQAYGDCCHNFKKACPREAATEVPANEVMVNTECVRKYEMLQGHYMVTSCPTDDAACVDDVKDPQRSVPVTDKYSQLTYTNSRCADCNNVTSALVWSVTIRCQEDLPTEPGRAPLTYANIWNNPHCFKYYKKPVGMTAPTRQCFPLIEKCVDTCQNQRLITECHNGAHSLIYDTECQAAYKNPECKMCAGGCSPYPSPTGPLTGRGLLTFSLSNIMRFNSQGSADDCSSGQIFLNTLKTCTSYVCPDGYVLRGDVCTNTSQPEATVCPTKELKPGQYGLSNDTVFLKLPNGDVPLDAANFTRGVNGSITMCIDTYENIVAEFQPSWDTLAGSVEGIITLLLMTISLVCLFIRISLQACVPLYQSQPGQMQFHLCLATFIAFLSFLIGASLTAKTSACYVIAVIDHWAFLAMFLWSSMLALDAWRTFRPSTSIGHSRSIRLYAVAAYLGPLLVVIPAVIVDHGSDIRPYFRPGYGDELCWISGVYGLGIFFMTPMAACLMLNIILLVATSLTLRKGLQLSASLSGRPSIHSVSLYAKLVVLLGVTWTTGFLATFINHSIAWIAFSVLNALQGVFLFVALTLRRKVWREVKGKLSTLSGTYSYTVGSSTANKRNHQASGPNKQDSG